MSAKGVHRKGRRITNRIERQGATMRNSVKRLNRKRISFSKSMDSMEPRTNEIKPLPLEYWFQSKLVTLWFVNKNACEEPRTQLSVWRQ
ncbi:MAG: hypothetical protein JKY09_03065 [Crocinitomicaceae bacterium]|nr:hypothetical protein [Crocinitomicaceae bacterium]